MLRNRLLGSLLVLTFGGAACSEPATQPTASLDRSFLQKHCLECHDADAKKGGLDLSSLPLDPGDARNFATWVKVHDRVRDGEMPPKKQARPASSELHAFLESLARPMIAADLDREAREGRATWRRLNRYEFENSLRDLLGAPWLQVKEMLPEDGEAHRFNKVGDALDVSHVQMAQYLAAAEYALREVMAAGPARPPTKTLRYHARDMKSFARRMTFNEFNRSPERATFPVLEFHGQPDVRSGKAPLTAGEADPAAREREAMAIVASSYEPLDLKFDAFKAPQAGRYTLRVSAYSVWVGPGKEPRWWTPDLDVVSRGRRPEPVTLYSELPPRQLRLLGSFDVGGEPTVASMDVHLLKGESIRPDASRLFRSRPSNWHNPLAEKDGQPGVAFRWLEVEGPMFDEWPTAGHRLLFGDLPMKESGDLLPKDPESDAERLLRGFLRKAYRRPVLEPDVARFLGVIREALRSGSPFAEAMIAGYSAVLCSPAFVCLQEKPGELDDFALASRLSYFLWNSAPDAALRASAERGELRSPRPLRAQIERLLDDPRARRFVDAFLDYWLDLRKINATSPDSALYPDYYLDDLLVESATQETQLFFAELLRGNLPARNLVSSDFVMVNERLAAHYGLAGVDGVAFRRVRLPELGPRGGLMTQAAVLKVTANGTTTSPVLRGAWIMERILGQPPPPPPPGVPAVEPDIRGAHTIREQLERHRTQPACAACHRKIDPAGFALENFDVVGGWRERYRALGEGPHAIGFGKNGQPFEFHSAQPVDASGEMPAGETFRDVVELKRLLLKDERPIARNLARQLLVYATGKAVRFGDRPRVEAILDAVRESGYGVRGIVREIILSSLFQRK
jgi:hypothetical protein